MEDQQFALDFIIKKIELFHQENTANLLIKCVFIDNEFEITSSRINIEEFKEGRSIIINNFNKEKLKENNILINIFLDDKDIGTVNIPWPENIVQEINDNNQAIHTGQYEVKDVKDEKIGTIDICVKIKLNDGTVNKKSSASASKGSELEPEDILFVIGDCGPTDKSGDNFNNQYPIGLCGGAACPASMKTDKYQVYNGNLYKNDSMIETCDNPTCGKLDDTRFSSRKQTGCQCGKVQTQQKVCSDICENSNNYPKPWDSIIGARDGKDKRKARSCRSIFGSDASCSGPCSQKKEKPVTCCCCSQKKDPCFKRCCCCCCESPRPKSTCSAKQHTKICPVLEDDNEITKNICKECGGLTISGVTCLTKAINKMPHYKITEPCCCCRAKIPIVKPQPKPICCCCSEQHDEYKAECSAKKNLCQTGEISPYNLCVMSKECLHDQDDDEQDIKDVKLNYTIRKCPICLTSMDWLPKNAACPRCCYRQPPILAQNSKKYYNDELTADLLLRKWSLERTNVIKRSLSQEKLKQQHICCKYKSRCKCCMKNLNEKENQQYQQTHGAPKEEYVPHLTETLNRLQQEFGGENFNEDSKYNKYKKDNNYKHDNNQKSSKNKKDRDKDNEKGYDKHGNKNRKKKINGSGDRISNSSIDEFDRKHGKKGKKGKKDGEIEEDRNRSMKTKNKKRSKHGDDSSESDYVGRSKNRKNGINKKRSKRRDGSTDSDDVGHSKNRKQERNKKRSKRRDGSTDSDDVGHSKNRKQEKNKKRSKRGKGYNSDSEEETGHSKNRKQERNKKRSKHRDDSTDSDDGDHKKNRKHRKNKKRSKSGGSSDSEEERGQRKNRKHGKNKNNDITTLKSKKTITTRKEFIYQMKKKNKKRYSYKFGKVHTGVVLGHKRCTVGLGLVPANMGWRWNVRTLGINTVRRGWRPGAVTKTIKELMTYFLGPCPCDTLPVTKPDRVNKCCSADEPEPVQKSTLRVQKANGEYTITMNPLKDAKTLEKSCDPYLHCKPIKFKIIKDKSSNENRHQLNNILHNDKHVKECICNEALRTCCCMNENDKQYIVNQLTKISDANPLLKDVNLGGIKLGELSDYNFNNGIGDYGGVGGRVNNGNISDNGTGTGQNKIGSKYNSGNGGKNGGSGYGPDNKQNNNINNNKLDNNKLDNNRLNNKLLDNSINNKLLDNKLLDKIKLKKLKGSSASESEMDIDFTPPAGLLKPKLKQKPDEIYRETQYDPNDLKMKSPMDDILNKKNKNSGNNGSNGNNANNASGKNKSAPLPPKRKPK